MSDETWKNNPSEVVWTLRKHINSFEKLTFTDHTGLFFLV